MTAPNMEQSHVDQSFRPARASPVIYVPAEMRLLAYLKHFRASDLTKP